MLSRRPPKGTVLCAVSELEDPGAKGFVFGEGGDRWEIFLVRRDIDIFCYENICPHMGIALNWEPDAFLTRDKDDIICATHGARFHFDNGMCTWGPCRGKSLTHVPIDRVNDVIRLA